MGSCAQTLCAGPHRWGDGPLRYLELLMFLNMTVEVEQLSFITYLHDKVRFPGMFLGQDEGCPRTGSAFPGYGA